MSSSTEVNNSNGEGNTNRGSTNRGSTNPTAATETPTAFHTAGGTPIQLGSRTSTQLGSRTSIQLPPPAITGGVRPATPDPYQTPGRSTTPQPSSKRPPPRSIAPQPPWHMGTPTTHKLTGFHGSPGTATPTATPATAPPARNASTTDTHCGGESKSDPPAENANNDRDTTHEATGTTGDAHNGASTDPATAPTPSPSEDTGGITDQALIAATDGAKEQTPTTPTPHSVPDDYYRHRRDDANDTEPDEASLKLQNKHQDFDKATATLIPHQPLKELLLEIRAAMLACTLAYDKTATNIKKSEDTANFVHKSVRTKISLTLPYGATDYPDLLPIYNGIHSELGALNEEFRKKGTALIALKLKTQLFQHRLDRVRILYTQLID